MKQESLPRYGAFLERGKIIALQTDGQGNTTGYNVESYDRPGIVAEGLTGMNGFSAEIGGKVFFYFFDDGTGLILRQI